MAPSLVNFPTERKDGLHPTRVESPLRTSLTYPRTPPKRVQRLLILHDQQANRLMGYFFQYGLRTYVCRYIYMYVLSIEMYMCRYTGELN